MEELTISIPAELSLTIDARQILVQEHFIGFQQKLDIESSNARNLQGTTCFFVESV